MTLTLGSLFDGIGGFPLAAIRQGITPLWASEIEPFPIQVTKHHFPETLHMGDITRLDGAKLAPVDIICGGSPCQDLSVASCTRAGLAGARSGLFLEQIRVTKEMRDADIRRGRTGKSGRMSPACSAAASLKGRTSGSSWNRSPELQAIPYLSLDLTPGAGNLLGNYEWELHSPWRGRSSTLNTGPAPPSGDAGCSLSLILQDNPPRKYYLTRRACLGILRRAKERGKPLPPQLHAALLVQAGLAAWDECGLADTRDITAGFSAGAGASAGSIGYSERAAPTLKAGQSGNRMPSVLCLNDQGGSVMDCTEDKTGTLRAQQHGHQPLVFENHGIDSRYTGPHPIVPTLSARAGTGGNNLPLALQPEPTMCICGNAIDRQPRNGGNGIGIQNDVAYTLTSVDRHAIFRRQRVDKFREDDTASTQSARQGKDATDLICQPSRDTLAVFLIRRLTPLECERLQGFPDGWTDLPGASDSARYKALGNSVPVPCVEYIMAGIARAAEGG